MASDETTKIIWTQHAIERQKEWENKLGITKEQVEEVLRNPGQIVAGYRDTLVAQSKMAGGLLRVPFVEVKEAR